MAQKKARKADKPKADKKKPDKPKPSKKKAEKKPKASKKKSSREADSTAGQDTPVDEPRPVLTEEDAMAMAEALVEMFNEGADHPVAFFVSGDEPLGRELIQLQGGDLEDMQGVVPVVLDAAQVRRYAMLTIADEMIWRQRQRDDG